HVLTEMVHVADGDAHLADRHPLGDTDRGADRTAQALDRVVLALAGADQQHPPDAAVRIRRIDHQRVALVTREVTAPQHTAQRTVVEPVDFRHESYGAGIALEDMEDEELRLQLISGDAYGGDLRLSHDSVSGSL